MILRMNASNALKLIKLIKDEPETEKIFNKLMCTLHKSGTLSPTEEIQIQLKIEEKKRCLELVYKKLRELYRNLEIAQNKELDSETKQCKEIFYQLKKSFMLG